jgi:hypothetical protein
MKKLKKLFKCETSNTLTIEWNKSDFDLSIYL